MTVDVPVCVTHRWPTRMHIVLARPLAFVFGDDRVIGWALAADKRWPPRVQLSDRNPRRTP